MGKSSLAGCQNLAKGGPPLVRNGSRLDLAANLASFWRPHKLWSWSLEQSDAHWKASTEYQYHLLMPSL